MITATIEKRVIVVGIDFGKLLGDAVKEVTGFVDRASKDITKAIDQNGDGKLDISDNILGALGTDLSLPGTRTYCLCVCLFICSVSQEV